MYALLNIFNDNRIEGLLYLQQAADRATSPEATYRLMNAAESAKKYIH